MGPSRSTRYKGGGAGGDTRLDPALKAACVSTRLIAHPFHASWFQIDSTCAPYNEALRALDMASLLGGPEFRAELESAISKVHSAIVSAKQTTTVTEEEGEEEGEDDGGGERKPKRRRTEDGGGDLLGGWRLGLEPACSPPLPPGSLEEGDQSLRKPVPRRRAPSLETFFCEHMAPKPAGRPVVITHAMEHWPALQRWHDPSYLAKVAGARTVPVEMGEHYLAGGWSQKLMTLEKFLSAHVRPQQQLSPEEEAEQGCEKSAGEIGAGSAGAVEGRGYLAQHALFEQVPALLDDIDLPDYTAMGEGQVQAINAWLGPAGTVSPVHNDPLHNLLAQPVGYKYVRLYAPDQAERLYLHEEPKLSNSGRVDVRRPDAAEEFPLFAEAVYEDVVVGPGEMLYIPPGWFHYVQAQSSSFSVSFWWR